MVHIVEPSRSHCIYLYACRITGAILVCPIRFPGLRVLHVDRNNYYGADTASLSLANLYTKFRDASATPPASLGHSRDWNVDLVPKFLMACGNLVKILLHSKVTRYLEFKSVDGSYVFKDGKVQKVPATPAEALSSSLMGFFEKRKFRSFLMFVSAYDKTKPATYMNGKSMDQVTTRQLYEYYGLDANTQAFTGHAMALHRDDDYLDQKAAETVEAIQLYAYSLERYGKSPYIYPIYGLGGLPEVREMQSMFEDLSLRFTVDLGLELAVAGWLCLLVPV
jgi:Rab GDP dissociation inhibitor